MPAALWTIVAEAYFFFFFQSFYKNAEWSSVTGQGFHLPAVNTLCVPAKFVSWR